MNSEDPKRYYYITMVAASANSEETNVNFVDGTIECSPALYVLDYSKRMGMRFNLMNHVEVSESEYNRLNMMIAENQRR